METPSRFERARTKIIATIGPACRTGEQMAELVRAGADVLRLNMAHATRQEHAETLAAIRETSRDFKQNVARPSLALFDVAH